MHLNGQNVIIYSIDSVVCESWVDGLIASIFRKLLCFRLEMWYYQ